MALIETASKESRLTQPQKYITTDRLNLVDGIGKLAARKQSPTDKLQRIKPIKKTSVDYALLVIHWQTYGSVRSTSHRRHSWDGGTTWSGRPPHHASAWATVVYAWNIIDCYRRMTWPDGVQAMNSMYSCLASSRRTYRNLLTRLDLTAASFLSVVGRCCVRSDTFLTRDALQRGYAVVNCWEW